MPDELSSLLSKVTPKNSPARSASSGRASSTRLAATDTPHNSQAPPPSRRELLRETACQSMAAPISAA